MSKYKLELTDTFGGEANYTWVKRTTLELPEGAGDKWLGVFAREWAGFTGVRCEVENDGNFGLVIRPRGMCQVLFVQFDDGSSDDAEVALRELVRWVESVGIEKNPVLAGIDVRPLENARRVLCNGTH